MKKVYFIFIIILCSVNVFAQDDENTITIDSPVYEGGLLVHTPKSYLLNPYMEGNVFNIIYQDPEKWDVVKRRALEYATKIWEENMQTAYPRINIQVNFQNFNNTTTATRTKIHTYDNVVEAPLNLDENTAIPGSIVKRYFNMGQYLCYIDEDIPNQLDQNIDISISFNDKEDLFYWNTDGRTDSDKLDFVTIALREIAKGLGFFSGVRKVGVNQFTTHHYDKVYPLDYLLKINRYEDRSSQLANAIQPASNKLFSNVIQNVYLYAPSTFIPNVSLNYFDEGTAANGDELMKPYVGKGESYHNIGEKLKKMLNEIGWVPAIPVGDGDNLVSSSTDANKTVGYKENYTVSYLSTRTAPSDPKLSPAPFINNFGLIYPRYGLWILKKDGTFKNVKQTDDVTFSISPKDVPDSEEWARSADGYLRACVSFYNLNYVRLKYLYLDFLPEKPELEMKLPQTLTRSISDKLRLGYKANAAKKITLWHETEDGITLYDIDPNQSIFDIDLNDLDETIENNFTIHCSNDNGTKISKTVTYGGEAFLLKKYNIITSLKLTDQTNFIKAELVSTDGFGTNIDDANYPQNITQLQVLNINNSSTVYVNTNKSKTVLVPASNLNKGIYAVQAIDEQGKVYSAKFIK